MIEIKLLANRRFIYSNRKHSIVITAENKATEITVSFPEEYEEYSKRVDFVNSQGKPWTKALFTPEFEEYPPDYNKTVFSFTLPDEVTKPGELKMQFLAYKPDESLTAVPFEIIPIQVDEGITCFKKGGKSNPDLLILSYNLANEALFNSQQAKSVSQAAETSILFRLNYNKRVRAGQFIEFRGDTYIIVSIDSFEYYQRDLTVRAEKVKPEVYDYEEYTEQ